jgi:hypothetical protein
MVKSPSARDLRRVSEADGGTAGVGGAEAAVEVADVSGETENVATLSERLGAVGTVPRADTMK